ncbi:MAG TPA: OsmC family protein [Vicinamibacteria bacterium]|nr:OsmC family protein [Vicinamibacteria bacterium]
MADGTARVELELDWRGDTRFVGHAGAVAMTLDGSARAGPTPVQALAFGLAGCMAIDVVHILTKGRLGVSALKVRLEGERAQEDPRRFVKFGLHFSVRGDVPADKMERALALSREKYCSVWHSVRQDIPLTTTFEIAP